MDTVSSCNLNLISALRLLSLVQQIIFMLHKLVCKLIPQIPDKSIKVIKLTLTLSKGKLVLVAFNLVVKLLYFLQKVVHLNFVALELAVLYV